MTHQAALIGGPWDGETIYVDSIISFNVLQLDGRIGVYIATSAERTSYEYGGEDSGFGGLRLGLGDDTGWYPPDAESPQS